MATAASQPHARTTAAPRIETLESRIRRRDPAVAEEQRKRYLAGVLSLPCWADTLYRFMPADPASADELLALAPELIEYVRMRYASAAKQPPSTTGAYEAATVAGILCWVAQHAGSEDTVQVAAGSAYVAIRLGNQLKANSLESHPAIVLLQLAEAEFLLRHGTSKDARSKSHNLLFQAVTRASAIQDPVHRAFACRKLGYLLSQHGERWEAFKWSMTAVLTAGIPRLDRWLGVRALFVKGY